MGMTELARAKSVAGVTRPSPPYPSLARQVRAFFRLYDGSDSERCRMHANAR